MSPRLGTVTFDCGVVLKDLLSGGVSSVHRAQNKGSLQCAGPGRDQGAAVAQPCGPEGEHLGREAVTPQSSLKTLRNVQGSSEHTAVPL